MWDVVDGQQRLSTIFQFLGILKDQSGKSIPPLTLQKTKYLPSLENVQWERSGAAKHDLPKELQLVFKRSKVTASIVLKESDESAKYELFQRLNTGGSQLSPQEVRNCLLLMINKQLFDWLKNLSNNEDFKEVAALSDRPIEESYDVELALRFIILAEIPEDQLKGVGDVGSFLTEKMTELAENKKFKRTHPKVLFEQTFETLNKSLGEEAFKRYSKKKKRHEGGFLLSLYETIALGVAYNIRRVLWGERRV